MIVAGSYVKMKATKKLNTIRLMDTRGNFYLNVRLPKSGCGRAQKTGKSHISKQERNRLTAKRWKENNPLKYQKHLKYVSQWRKDNRKKALEYNQKWRANNRQEYNAQQREYRARKKVVVSGSKMTPFLSFD